MNTTTIQHTHDLLFRNDTYGKLHVMIRNDEARFVLNDVAESLKINDIESWIQANGHIVKSFQCGFTPCDIAGKSQEILTINEAGLLDLIFADDFKSVSDYRFWIISDVIPILHKLGVGYYVKRLNTTTSDPFVSDWEPSCLENDFSFSPENAAKLMGVDLNAIISLLVEHKYLKITDGYRCRPSYNSIKQGYMTFAPIFNSYNAPANEYTVKITVRGIFAFLDLIEEHKKATKPRKKSCWNQHTLKWEPIRLFGR